MESASMLILTYGSSIEQSSTFTTVDSSLRQPPDIEDFWTMETIGIIDDPTRNDDEVAMRKFKETLKFENGRYQAAWPWKNDTPE
ncbi:hypothetical protein DPMN_134907 [Dreissena polymorpha]|uniref:Uncharacterized protein n=1 Tax=Dreissena polymorpha TaxID=45954 RepID=A0A9D4JE74_DREPO|nr:hypothetical protein DPMN_134907 [Dreissena polymorpha]